MGTHAVAPLVGAWIEMVLTFSCCFTYVVAPLVGAWIEIEELLGLDGSDVVAPLVGAWIEISSHGMTSSTALWVAPLVGAWIEMMRHVAHPKAPGRTPRGCVD